MHQKLCAHIVDLADAFNKGRVKQKLKPLADATISRAIAGKDGKFVGDCRVAGERSFTGMTFDEVVLGFATHWPHRAKWPHGVKRPRIET